MLYLGVDPGSKGAIFAIQNDDISHVDFSSNDNDILNFLLLAKLSCDEYLCGLENVGSRPEDGVRQAFTFGSHFGRIKTLLNVANVKYVLIQPQKWINYIGWGRVPKGKENYDKRKKELHKIAKEITGYKGLTVENSDAFLIAHYLKIVPGTKR